MRSSEENRQIFHVSCETQDAYVDVCEKYLTMRDWQLT